MWAYSAHILLLRKINEHNLVLYLLDPLMTRSSVSISEVTGSWKVPQIGNGRKVRPGTGVADW